MPKADNKISDADRRWEELRKNGEFARLMRGFFKSRDEFEKKKPLSRGKRIQK